MTTLLTVLLILGGLLIAGLIVGLVLSMMLVALISGNNGDFELNFDEDDIYDHPRIESEKF